MQTLMWLTMFNCQQEPPQQEAQTSGTFGAAGLSDQAALQSSRLAGKQSLGFDDWATFCHHPHVFNFR